jgi:hypothetical protein
LLIRALIQYLVDGGPEFPLPPPTSARSNPENRVFTLAHWANAEGTGTRSWSCPLDSARRAGGFSPVAEVRNWHNPAAPADSQWVRLLRYCGPSVVFRVNVTWLGGTNNNRALLCFQRARAGRDCGLEWVGRIDRTRGARGTIRWQNYSGRNTVRPVATITRMPSLRGPGRVRGPKDHHASLIRSRRFSRCPLLYHGIFSFGSTAPRPSRRSTKRWSCMRRLASTLRAWL